MWTSWQDNNSLYWQVDVSNLSGCLWGYYHNLEKGNCLETPNVLLFNAEGVHEMRPHILKSHSVFFRLWSKILQTKILMNSSPNKTPCLKNTKPSHLIPLRSAFIAHRPHPACTSSDRGWAFSCLKCCVSGSLLVTYVVSEMTAFSGHSALIRGPNLAWFSC